MSNSFYINNIEPVEINYNSEPVKSVYYNNNVVWRAKSNTFKLVSTSSIQLTASGGKGWNGIMEYSQDGGSTWKTWTGTAITSGSVNGERVLCLRGTGNTVVAKTNANDRCWTISGKNVRCVGNIEVLLDYETVENGGHPPMGDSCFANLFRNCTHLIEAPELPATNLTYGCYADMFMGTSITKAPELPATNLADWCYSGMFSYCTALTTVPTLPATTLADWCYTSMFHSCTTLTELPALPATTLAEWCYNSMFYNCSQIVISTTKTNTCPYAYRIPSAGVCNSNEDALGMMFSPMVGDYDIQPNTTYYVNLPVIS